MWKTRGGKKMKVILIICGFVFFFAFVFLILLLTVIKDQEEIEERLEETKEPELEEKKEPGLVLGKDERIIKGLRVRDNMCYTISLDGTVRRYYYGKIIIIKPNASGHIAIGRDANRVYLTVPRLLLENFTDQEPKKYVLHRDGNKKNNSLDNLYFSDKPYSTKKRVLAIDENGGVIKRYDSIREAANALGLTNYKISTHLYTGEPIKGITYVYEDEYEDKD